MESRAFACRIKSDWALDPARSNSNLATIPVSADDKGWLLKGNNDWSFVALSYAGNLKTGWVPTKVIDKGVPRINHLVIQFPDLKPSSRPAAQPPPSDNVLQKTLKSIWDTIKSNPATAVCKVDQSNDNITKVLFGEEVDHYVDMIYRNIVPKAWEIMQNGSFNPRDLIDKMEPVSESNHNVDNVFGIYIYFFQDITNDVRKFISNPPPRDAVYIGQTVDFVDRQKSHAAHFKKPRREGDAKVHQVGRTARESKMVPFIVIRHDDPKVAHFGLPILLEAAELTAACLFRSWFPLLYATTPQSGSGGQISVPHEYAKIYVGIMDRIQSVTG